MCTYVSRITFFQTIFDSNPPRPQLLIMMGATNHETSVPVHVGTSWLAARLLLRLTPLQAAVLQLVAATFLFEVGQSFSERRVHVRRRSTSLVLRPQRPVGLAAALALGRSDWSASRCSCGGPSAAG
jgi:hypothetical protein